MASVFNKHKHRAFDFFMEVFRKGRWCKKVILAPYNQSGKVNFVERANDVKFVTCLKTLIDGVG